MLSHEVQEEYLDLRRRGVGAITAARAIHVPADEMQRYINMVPEFGAKVEEALAERIERVENKAWELAQDGNFKEMELVLTTQASKDWMRPDKEMILKLQQQTELSDEDLTELHRRLEMRQKAIDVPSELVEKDDDA